MAGIQDLPPELLYRILELAVGGLYSYQRTHLLRVTSLVARNWTAPSKDLLERDLVLNIERTVSDYLRHARQGSVGRVQSLVLFPTAIDSVDEIRALLSSMTSLKYLQLGDTVESDILSAEVLGRLKRLGLDYSLNGSLVIPPRVALRSLTLDNAQLDVVGSLLDAALSLRSLCLALATQLTMTPSLLSAAPRLTHLDLRGMPKKDEDLPPLQALLTTSTSLQVFRVIDAQIEKVVQLLEVCPSQLLELDFYWVVSKDPSCQSLVEALKLSSLRKLRRWRISWTSRFVSTSSPYESAWRRACTERGIEVRGNERYFTD